MSELLASPFGVPIDSSVGKFVVILLIVLAVLLAIKQSRDE
jgi:hypothetical protein